MNTYLDCWITAATALFSQALAGEPQLAESLPKPMTGGAFGFEYTLRGDIEGRFVLLLDAALLQAALLGDGMDQKTGWSELLKEVVDAAAGDMLPKAGKKCRVEAWKEVSGTAQISRAFQLKSAAGMWTILVRDETQSPKAAQAAAPPPSSQAAPGRSGAPEDPLKPPVCGPRTELLLDVELETALRFGCREMPLGDILDLGAGDVVELDRHVTDPVDLIVGDRIVARGEVVLANGNFALRVTEVATPRKRLESIRCLF